MLAFDPAVYGPVLAPLLNVDRRRPLGGGSPNRQMRPLLETLSVESAFAHAPRVVDRNMAEGCLAGVWLLYDCLDESHAISQGIDTPTGSFWHAIMHRREGDFSNAKYWFRRVGGHPVFDQLADAANDAGTVPEIRLPIAGGAWDPFGFVDLCQAAGRESLVRDACLDFQQAEWERLFDFCYQSALRAAP